MKRTGLISVLIVWAFVFTGADTALAGEFKHAVYYKAGLLPYHVVATQLTNSGNLDLAVADYLNNQIVVLLGKGDGTFRKPLKFAVPLPIGLAVGDFNGDGKEDLIIVESRGTGAGVLAVFLGHGDGKFSLRASYQIGSEAGCLTAADFDGDGKLDVAETDLGDGSESVLRVFRGTGKGTLLKPRVYKNPVTLGQLAAGDLNGDGHPDLVVATSQGHTVEVLINDGIGGFEEPVSYSVGGDPVDVKIADLLNDGKQDLVVADDVLGVDVWLNNGDGTFGEPTTYAPTFFGWEPPEACTVADFNLDGHLDVACAASESYAYFFDGKGKGKFGSAHTIKESIQGAGGFSIASGDFNNDGAPDLAIPIQNYGKVAILLNAK